MKKVAAIMITGLLAACASGGGKGEDPTMSGGSGETAIPSELEGAPPPALPPVASETPGSRRQRVQTLERSIDNWWEARHKRQYGTQESLETMLRTYTRDHLDEILSDLQYGSIRHRRIAAVALGFSGSARAADPLYAALGDAYPDVVKHSLLGLWLLVRPGPKVSAPRVISSRDLPGGATYAADKVTIETARILPFLQNPNPDLRANAALVISQALRNGQKVQDETVLSLINAREDRNEATRVHVVAALGQTGSDLAFPHLVRAVLDDPIALVRIRAAHGLARLDNPAAAAYLIQVLGKPAEVVSVKEACRDALRLLLNERNLPSLRPEDWRPIAEAKGLL